MSDAQAGIKESPRSLATTSTAEPAAVVSQAPPTPVAQPSPTAATPQRSTQAPTQTVTPSPAAPVQPPQTVKLPIDGVDTEMPMSVVVDLLAKGREVGKAEEVRNQAQKLRTDLGIDAQWSEFLARAHPSRRDAIMALTRDVGPMQAIQPAAPPSGDFQEVPTGNAPDPRIAQLEATVAALAQDAQARYHRDQFAQRATSVDQALDQTPVFRSNAAAREAAKHSILRELQLNPKTDVPALIATEAQRFTAILGQASKAAPASAAAPGQPAPAAASSQQPRPTVSDWSNRSVRKGLLQKFIAGLG